MKEFKDPISPVLAQILSKKEERTCFNCGAKYTNLRIQCVSQSVPVVA